MGFSGGGATIREGALSWRNTVSMKLNSYP